MPRVFDKIYRTATAGIANAPGFVQRLWDVAFAHKLAAMQAGWSCSYLPIRLWCARVCL